MAFKEKDGASGITVQHPPKHFLGANVDVHSDRGRDHGGIAGRARGNLSSFTVTRASTPQCRNSSRGGHS